MVNRLFPLLLLMLVPMTALCQHGDLVPPSSQGDSLFSEDEHKDADVLLEEAEQLFLEERPLDARTKLLTVLKKDPDNYQAHVLLSGYYLIHVGHFRLSLKYIKKAMTLYRKEHGPPPYSRPEDKIQHAHQLHLLSQARLNLDNYQGALEALQEYETSGYYQDWYPGSKAWILMKQGKLDEAIKVARLGLLTGGEKGRTLNILGILLSMTGEREQSLRVFKEAITHELSLGMQGQPATPLNNSGEVFREIYQEESAEKYWLKAVSLPDGCEHVLPSLNLAILRMERLDFSGAKQSIDNFESCIAQYPLRNGEEHRALVHLAKGRIALMSGNIDDALKHLEKTLLRRQWFGKIGASENDLTIAALLSYAEALEAKGNRLGFIIHQSYSQKLQSLLHRSELAIQAWWLRRRAQQVFIEDLNDGEDLFVRHTDSLLDYAALGEALKGIDMDLLEEKINSIKKEDKRQPSEVYYQAYLALANQGLFSRKMNYSSLLHKLRDRNDDALKLRILLHILNEFSSGDERYRSLAQKIFRISRPALINAGHALPVNLSSNTKEIEERFSGSPFTISNSLENENIISHSQQDGLHSLTFFSRSGAGPRITVRGSDLTDVINQLTESVFRITLS